MTNLNRNGKRAGAIALALSLSVCSANVGHAQTLSACPAPVVPAAAQVNKIYMPAIGNLSRMTVMPECSAEPWPTLEGATALARTLAAYYGIRDDIPDVEYLTYEDGALQVEVTFGDEPGCWVWVSYRPFEEPGYQPHVELDQCQTQG